MFNSTRYFWIQDVVDMHRSDDEFNAFGLDGESMRYSLSPNYISKYEKAFDINVFKPQIKYFEVYNPSPQKSGNKDLNFISFMQGYVSKNNNPKMGLEMGLIHYIRIMMWRWNIPDFKKYFISISHDGAKKISNLIG